MTSRSPVITSASVGRDLVQVFHRHLEILGEHGFIGRLNATERFGNRQSVTRRHGRHVRGDRSAHGMPHDRHTIELRPDMIAGLQFRQRRLHGRDGVRREIGHFCQQGRLVSRVDHNISAQTRCLIQAPYALGVMTPQPWLNMIKGSDLGVGPAGSKIQYSLSPSPYRCIVISANGYSIPPGPDAGCGGGVATGPADATAKMKMNRNRLIYCGLFHFSRPACGPRFATTRIPTLNHGSQANRLKSYAPEHHFPALIHPAPDNRSFPKTPSFHGEADAESPSYPAAHRGSEIRILPT